MTDKMQQDAINFRWAYALLIALAKRILAEENKTCGDSWPAGQSWGGLSGSSKAVFLRRARDEAGIDHDSFLACIREGLYDVGDLFDADGDDYD